MTSIAWGDQTWGFAWDTAANGIGKLGKFSDGDGATTYSYDAQGHTTSVSRTSTAGLTQTVGYGWGPGNRLTAITYPSGLVVGYTWQNGVITAVTVNGHPLISNIIYQAWNAPLSWTWANGQVYNRTGDAVGRTAGLTTGDANKTYQYDNVGNVTNINDSAHAPLSTAFHYDSMDRTTLQSMANGSSWSYTYDLDGNRLTSGAGATTYTYGTASNQLNVQAVGINFGYDAAGNQTSRGGGTQTYNNAGRMIGVQESGAFVGSYVYNAMGQRVQKTAAGTTSRFVYDEDWHLLGEYATTGTPVQETVFLGDWPVATVRLNAAKTAVAYYVWPGHLGSPRQVTDPATNKVVWRWDSGPFGADLPNQDPQNVGSVFVYNMRFAGQYWDNELSKMSNGFREYDPYIGRYLQSDPIGLGGGINTYGYVGGKPLTYVDPFGLAIKCKTILKLPGYDVQNCKDDGQAPSEQDAKDAKRMSNSELDKACKNNGYKDAHDMKDRNGLDSKSDIFADRDGNMYSGPRKGTGLPEWLHMNTKGW